MRILSTCCSKMEGNSGGRPVLLGKLFLISLMLSQIAARYCRDKYCQDPISEGKVINTFDSEDENFLSVQKGDTVFIISKSENRKLFEVQVSGSRGLVPAKFIKETRPFVQEENLLHIVHDNIEDDNNDDVDSTSNEKTRDPDEEMSKNAESKQMQRNKLLQFVQDIEGEINSSASTDKKEDEEQTNTTFSSPYKKSDVEGSVSLVKEDGSVEGVDRSSNNNNEDDLQDEDVGFKGAVTAPHANEQDRMDDEGRFNHDKMPSNEEWMKNPQFLELRERQLEDYMKDHFTRQETTVEIRRLALDLITNDLLAQVNNRENGLYEMLRHSNPQEDTTGGSSKDHHGIEDMKDKEPTSAENLQSLKEDDPLHINDMDGIKSKGDMGKPGERTDIPKTSSVLDQEALSGSSQTQSFYSPHESLSPVQNIVLENDFGVAEERGKSDSVEGDQPKDLKATSPASSTSLWSTMINDGTVSTMEDGSGNSPPDGLNSHSVENGDNNDVGEVASDDIGIETVGQKLAASVRQDFRQRRAHRLKLRQMQLSLRGSGRDIFRESDYQGKSTREAGMGRENKPSAGESENMSGRISQRNHEDHITEPSKTFHEDRSGFVYLKIDRPMSTQIDGKGDRDQVPISISETPSVSHFGLKNGEVSMTKIGATNGKENLLLPADRMSQADHVHAERVSAHKYGDSLESTLPFSDTGELNNSNLPHGANDDGKAQEGKFSDLERGEPAIPWLTKDELKDSSDMPVRDQIDTASENDSDAFRNSKSMPTEGAASKAFMTVVKSNTLRLTDIPVVNDHVSDKGKYSEASNSFVAKRDSSMHRYGYETETKGESDVDDVWEREPPNSPELVEAALNLKPSQSEVQPNDLDSEVRSTLSVLDKASKPDKNDNNILDEEFSEESFPEDDSRVTRVPNGVGNSGTEAPWLSAAPLRAGENPNLRNEVHDGSLKDSWSAEHNENAILEAKKLYEAGSTTEQENDNVFVQSNSMKEESGESDSDANIEEPVITDLSKDSYISLVKGDKEKRSSTKETTKDKRKSLKMLKVFKFIPKLKLLNLSKELRKSPADRAKGLLLQNTVQLEESELGSGEKAFKGTDNKIDAVKDTQEQNKAVDDEEKETLQESKVEPTLEIPSSAPDGLHDVSLKSEPPERHTEHLKTAKSGQDQPDGTSTLHSEEHGLFSEAEDSSFFSEKKEEEGLVVSEVSSNLQVKEGWKNSDILRTESESIVETPEQNGSCTRNGEAESSLLTSDLFIFHGKKGDEESNVKNARIPFSVKDKSFVNVVKKGSGSVETGNPVSERVSETVDTNVDHSPATDKSRQQVGVEETLKDLPAEFAMEQNVNGPLNVLPDDDENLYPRGKGTTVESGSTEDEKKQFSRQMPGNVKSSMESKVALEKSDFFHQFANNDVGFSEGLKSRELSVDEQDSLLDVNTFTPEHESNIHEDELSTGFDSQVELEPVRKGATNVVDKGKGENAGLTGEAESLYQSLLNNNPLKFLWTTSKVDDSVVSQENDMVTSSDMQNTEKLANSGRTEAGKAESYVEDPDDSHNGIYLENYASPGKEPEETVKGSDEELPEQSSRILAENVVPIPDDVAADHSETTRISVSGLGMPRELEINGLPSANQAEKEVEVRPTPSKGNEDQDNNFSTLQYNLLTSTPSFSNDAVSTHSKEPLVEEQESAKEKVDVVKEEERSIEQTDLRLEGKVIEEKKESGKEEAKKEDQKDAGEYPSSSTESAIADQLSQSSTAATSHEPARQTSDKQDADPRLSTEGQSQDDKTEEKKESGKEEAKKEDQKDAGEYSSSSTESAIADQLSQSSTAATLHEPVRQTSDKQDVDPRLSTEGQSQDDKTTPDEPIAAPSLPNLHPTHYEDRNTNSISPSPTVNLEESTHGVVSDHQPTHGTTTEIEDREREEEEKNREPEEEKGREEENLSESTNEQLLALCHAHPTLEACARLRGAKISRGSKDMDLQQTKTRPRQTLLYKLHRILLLILRTFNGWIIRIIKLFLSIIRAPFCLLGLSKPFDCVIDGLDQMCSFTVGTITVMVLMYPMIISPTVRFILYMKNRNKAVKMRSDCERSYIERAKISAEYCDKYRGEMKEAKEKLRIERQERELVEHQMTELRDTIDKLKEVLNKEKSLAETNLKDLQAALKEQDDLRTMIEKKEQEIAQADLVVSKHQKEIENQRETTNSLTTRLEEFQVELTLKDNEIENLQNLVGATEREKALMEHLKDELTEDLKNLETRLKDIEKSVAGKEQERELLEDQLETKDTELEVLRGILMTINTEKNLDGETKDSYEAPDDDPDIQAEQLKKERLTKLMDATAAMTQVKSLEEENKVLTEALGDEIEARKSLEADLEKTKRELQEASNNYREFKAKADAGEIKLTTLRDYFHAQEAELHRKLAAQETARIVSERRLDESMADSTSSVQEAGMLRKQLEDLKQEIRAVERSKQDSENKKDMDYHDLYVKTRQCQRDLEEMTRERDYYRKRLLDKEPLKRSPPPQTRKAGSEGHGSPRDSVDGGRAVSPQSQHSGKFSGIAPGGIGVMGAPFRPIPAQGMMGGMPPPVPPIPPMPGGFFPGMMPPAMMPPGMMPLVGMPGTSTPPQAGQVGSPLTAGGSAAMRPPFRQRLSDISAASVPPSSMTQPNAGLQNTNTMSPFNMQTPPTVQQPSQLVRPVPRTSTPGMAFSGSAHGSNSAFQVHGHAGMQQQTLEQRGPRSQFYSPQSGFSPVQNQTHPGLNNTFPGQAAASGDQGKGHNTLV